MLISAARCGLCQARTTSAPDLGHQQVAPAGENHVRYALQRSPEEKRHEQKTCLYSPATRESQNDNRDQAFCFAFADCQRVSLLMMIRAASVGSHQFCSFASCQRAVLGRSVGWSQQQRQQPYNPFGGFWGDRPGGFWGDRQREAPRYPRQRERAREPEREQPPDYSRAPPATPRKDATVKIVVMGDANADWLAYGLEDAYSENPEIGIVRKHRTDSGLISYDARRDTEWPQVAREIIAAEKPKFIVMMIGNNDRQTIREKVPPPPPSGAPKANAPPAPSATRQARRAAGPRAAAARGSRTASPHDAGTGAPGGLRPLGIPLGKVGARLHQAHRRHHCGTQKRRCAGDLGWSRFAARHQVERKIHPTLTSSIAAGPRRQASSMSTFGTASSMRSGRYSPQGPDYEGQIRRLRTGDGVYFTKFGARKLAHYVEREVERIIGNKGLPVALPIPARSCPAGAESQAECSR